MIVDKKIELEIKLLKDFPDWEFLPYEDLKRKTKAAPKDVSIHVNNPAYKACNTGLDSDLKNSNIDSKIYNFKSSPVQN